MEKWYALVIEENRKRKFSPVPLYSQYILKAIYGFDFVVKSGYVYLIWNKGLP